MKTCTRCLETKEYSSFSKNKSKKDGLDGWCLICKRQYQADYNKSRREIQKEYARNRRSNFPDEIKKSKKKHYAKNKAIIASRNGKYQRRKLDSDNLYRIKHLLRDRLRKAIKNDYKSGSAVKDLGCSVEFLKQYLEAKFYNGMSWDSYGSNHGKWQIDHITPLCKFDLSNREEFLKACHYTNLQPLWYEDHIKKTTQDMKNEAN